MRPKVLLHRPKRLPEAVELPPARAFARVLAKAGATGGEVSLVLAGADELRRLNRDFRGKDRPTDVLAFDYEEGARRTPPPDRGGEPPAIWGDVFVSVDAALAQARERGIPAGEELARLLLHGCLHLLGHRDGSQAESARMEAVQESLLPELLSRIPRKAGR